MRLIILALILAVLCTCIEGQARRARRCHKSSQCRKDEKCVRVSTFWWYRLGICKPRVRRCTTGADCKSEECCQSTVLRRGKRQTGGRSGVCKPLQPTGKKCFLTSGSEQSNGIVSSCPCESGSLCQGLGINERPFGETGVCRKQCTSGEDCGPEECCESINQPKGRKKRQTVGNNGVCKPLQSSSKKCFTTFGSGKPARLVSSCPCESGSICQGIGSFEPPLGETGVCRKPCTSGADCGPEECCESINQPKGRKKRQTVGSNGVCKPLQSSSKKCFTTFGSGKPDELVSSCPCESGSTCQGSGLFEQPLGETGVCRKPCTSGADCGPEECCESIIKPIGRKKRQTLGSNGICKPLLSNGKKCYTTFGSGKPAGMLPFCPCESGSTCQGSGLSEVPLGETGTCG